MGGIDAEAMNSNAWPFQEARRLLEHLSRHRPDATGVLFQTGYGPSGLPHIGTFGEVARTSMVRAAFGRISDLPSRLICFSDDMDGLRKVPLNIPDRDGLEEDLHLPLTSVRDPFGTHPSFAEHNNAELRTFLDRFGFDYEFVSATEHYRSGRFDEMLLTVLERFDRIMEIMLPSLGGVEEGRRDTYSPFLPISPKSGRVLQVPTLERSPSKGTIVYREPDGELVEIPVTGGAVKLQWKPDWAMRWAALGVDYEMYGKDLGPSAELGAKLCRVLGKPAPAGMMFELFLDEAGRKISKSRGLVGLSIDDWLAYAPQESLGLFMYNKPKTAKRLFHEVIPKSVDEYHQHLRAFVGQDEAARLANPVWHIHCGNPPPPSDQLSYSMLLNLGSAVSAEDSEVLWRFVRKYRPGSAPDANPELAELVEGAVRYLKDVVAPGRSYRSPTPPERSALEDLGRRLEQWSGGDDPETLQTMVYSVGTEHGIQPLRNWFRAIYEVLLGSSQGPRFGSFIALYGIKETAELISERLSAAA